MARQIDTSSIKGLKTVRDFDIENSLVDQKLAAGNVANAQAGNIHATQMLSAAAASGDPNIYLGTKQKLANMGVDMSGWSDDINVGAQQAQAARLAQSPLGSLLNAGLKAEGNTISATNAMGNIDAGKALTPLSQILAGGGLGLPMGGAGGAAMGGGVGNPSLPPALPAQGVAAPAQAAAGDPMAEFQGALAVRQAQNGVSPAQTPDRAALTVAAPAPAQAAPSLQQQPGETNAAYISRLQNDPSHKKDMASAEKSGTSMGEDIGEAQKTVHLMQANLPMVLQRFSEMRQAAQDASSGMGVNPDGSGWSVDMSKSLGTKAANANALLKQRESMGILPEIAPQLAGLKPNKFLEGISTGASGLELDTPPDVKKNLIDGLQNQYINSLKSNAERLRSAGQPAPSNDEIDAAVAKQLSQVQQNPALTSLPSSAPASPYKVGQVLDSPSLGKVVFMGGNAADPKNYRKVQ